jgi:poly(A) polymerase
MVESRIRHLVLDLENTDNILIAHPSTITINNSFICLTDEEQAGASQGELSMDAMQRKDEDFKDKDHKRVHTKNFFIGLEIEKKPSKSFYTSPVIRLMNPEDGSGSRILNLFYPSKRFCGGCQQWDRYDEQEMSVILRPVKRLVHLFRNGHPN